MSQRSTIQMKEKIQKIIEGKVHSLIQTIQAEEATAIEAINRENREKTGIKELEEKVWKLQEEIGKVQAEITRRNNNSAKERNEKTATIRKACNNAIAELSDRKNKAIENLWMKSMTTDEVKLLTSIPTVNDLKNNGLGILKKYQLKEITKKEA